MNNVFLRQISKSVCQDLQWKTGGRGVDKRQGLSCFINILGVIGGKVSIALPILELHHKFLFFIASLSLWRRSKNEPEPIPVTSLIYWIQAARKLAAKAYREAKKQTSEDALRNAAPPLVEETENCRNAELDARILLVLRAIDDFKIPARGWCAI